MPHVFINGPVSWNTVAHLDTLPGTTSQTVFATAHRDGLGGTSAGKAVTLAALGVDVTLSTLLGEDDHAAKAREHLGHPRIQLVAEPGVSGRTERHVNLLAADGSRLSVYLELPTPGPGSGAPARDALRRADVAVLDLALQSQMLLDAARAAGTPVWCDVHDHDGTEEFQRTFADAAEVVLVSGARLADPRAYLRARLAAGARLAVCSFGADGALALDGDGWLEVGTADAGPVRNTDGAGDAFLAGLLRGHLDGMSTPDALRLGAATGAIAVADHRLGAPDASLEHARSLAATVPARRV